MSQAPPPYPGDEKGGSYPPPPNPSYPPPQGGYPPQGFSGPPPQGYGPQQGYGPPPQGYGPQQGYGQQYGQSTVVVTQPTMTVIQQFRESPVHTKCPHCQAEIVTATHYETGTLAWIICVVLCFVGLGAGCCLIPFCVDGCKDVIHSCPNCRQTISRYSRM